MTMHTTLPSSEKISPMMKQWASCKKSAAGALLLFRMGDFYEAFHEDAEILSLDLSLTLTKRQGVAMAGIPVQSLEGALEKLSARGKRVAVAEQMEDPKKTKGIVDRQIVRVITPGTFTPSHDSGKSHNWIVSLFFDSQKEGSGALAACDTSTWEMVTCFFDDPGDLEAELAKLKPKEILISNKASESTFKDLIDSISSFVSTISEIHFDLDRAKDSVKNHFKIHSEDSFGLGDLPSCTRCIGALISYLKDNLRIDIDPLKSVQILPREGILQIDRNCQKNLEIREPIYEGQLSNTLYYHLNQTLTPMGSRLLSSWLVRPLKDPVAIAKRADAIEELLLNLPILHALQKQLSLVRDLRRLSSKILSQSISARDLVALRSSLAALPALSDQMKGLQKGLWLTLKNEINLFEGEHTLLKKTLKDEVAAKVGEGPIILEGFNSTLDELRSLRSEGQDWLISYGARLKEELGIKTLRVGYTPAFGYYIEVSKGQSSLMPSEFSRRQTLVSSERYISHELKEYEDKVLHAKERMEALEKELLAELVQKLVPSASGFIALSETLATIDCLLSLAQVAHEHSYIRPVIDQSDTLEIVAGRHPIVEKMIGFEKFIANDTYLPGKNSKTRMMILTGPNMAGKSTYIRQVALLVLMAQIGSFVPAASMHLGVVDRIFTRVGASDDLARGQSTFMVEMSETANILHNATSRSLVILDEVGRGTSTYDGIAIARSIAEYLLQEKNKKPKTLFATHYSELTDLSEQFKEVSNYQVAVKELQDEVLFLHKIAPGSADKSYGIHVARLAGLPSSVIERARAILASLEKQSSRKSLRKSSPQLELFTGIDFQASLAIKQHTQEPSKKELETKAKLASIDFSKTTPLQAMQHLSDLIELWK